MQRGPPTVVAGVDIGAPVEEKSNDPGIAVTAHRVMEGSLEAAIVGGDVRASVQLLGNLFWSSPPDPVAVQ